MRRTFLLFLLAALCAALLRAPDAAAAAGRRPVAAYLSAPVRAATGTKVRVEALVVNPNDTPATPTYEAKVHGLAVDKRNLKKRVWLGPKAYLHVRWQAKAGSRGEAKFALFVDGTKAGDRTIRVHDPIPPPVLTRVGALTAKPMVVTMPEPGKTYVVELEVTAGARGELASTVARLREVPGLGTDAIIARGLVPAALTKGGQPPELRLLYALQDSSGGWGSTPLAAPDVRTTSWAVFWLGHFAKAGGKVDAKALDAAVGYLRKNLAGASVEMRARVLPALAANNRATKKDLAAVPGGSARELTTMGRLLAAYGGADVALPAQAAWGRLNARETSVLVCHLAGKGAGAEAASLLRRLVMLRGAQPCFRTHEAPLYALASKRLVSQAKWRAVVSVTLGGNQIGEFSIHPKNPVVRRTFRVEGAQAGGRKSRVSVTCTGGGAVFCRIVVRRAG